MRYFGGKTRTCKEIADSIQYNLKKGQLFISPFVGGGWVECLVQGTKECYDKHRYLIAMYNELQRGWKPPEVITKEQYDYVREHPDVEPHLTGFVGFGCSFAGKWFGGYAKDSSDRNFCLNARNSILRKIKGFRNTKFECKDYKDISPSGAVIYCDPPYEGTAQYSKQIVGDFDSDEFWATMRKWSENNVVIISEYNAPDDFNCIWEQTVQLDMRDSDNKKEIRKEKLFSVSKDVKMKTRSLFDCL